MFDKPTFDSKFFEMFLLRNTLPVLYLPALSVVLSEFPRTAVEYVEIYIFFTACYIF